MMWVLWAVLSSLGIAATLASVRYYAPLPSDFLKGYIIYITGVVFITGWVTPYSYLISPTFTHTYIMQAGLLSLMGVFIGKYVFGDVLTVYQYFGVVLVVIGNILLGIK